MEGLLKKENKEALSAKTSVVSSEELADRIYQGESLPQDPRFLSYERGGVFRFFDPRELSAIHSFTAESKSKFYPLIEVGGEVVGLSELEQDIKDAHNLWIKFVSVDPKYQGNGYSTKLIEEIFRFAKEKGYSLQPSFYTEEGRTKLKAIVERCAKETGVELKTV